MTRFFIEINGLCSRSGRLIGGRSEMLPTAPRIRRNASRGLLFDEGDDFFERFGAGLPG